MVGALCLLLSGAAALFYELVWTHQFSIVFGSSSIATASVLGIYLAGLGVGASLALRSCRSSRRPLLTYALLEGMIALSALAVPPALDWCQQLFFRGLATDGVPPASFGGSWSWQLAITAALLAIPTLCLGASFPYAIRGLVHDDRRAGTTTAWLYSANTLGAVAGSLTAGLLLLPAVGIQATTWVGAALSLTAAGLALTLPRHSGAPQPAASACERGFNANFPFTPVVILAGAVSLGTQILWTRLLIHFVGSGLYALSILLATFLLGLAVGAAVAGIIGTKRSRNAVGFVVAQLFVAAWAGVAFVALNSWTAAGQPAVLDFSGRLLRGATIAALTLLPIAAGSGAAFLFAIGAKSRSAADAAPAVASAYRLTALGNLAGGIVLALVVFPRLGFGGSQALLIALSLSAAVIAAWRTPARWLSLAGAGSLALWLLIQPLPRGDTVLTFSPLTGSSEPGGVIFAELGTSASVVLTEREGEWSLRTNGLAEGSMLQSGISTSRYQVTRWLGMLPFLARPEASEALVIGLGAGTTVDAIPHTARRVVVVEIERQVVAANRFVAARRQSDPLADPRVELVINDARDVLHRSRQRFDVIISQPSHPWTAGAANLYTREFFTAARARLRPGGVLAQWLGLPFVDAELLRSVLATLAEVFPHVEVYRPPTGAALIFLASEQPLELGLPLALSDELAALGIGRREDLAARWVLSTAGVRRAAASAPPVTDDRNLLASRAPRILGRGLARSLGREVLAAEDPLLADIGTLDRLALIDRLIDPERAERLARAEPDAARRQLALSFLSTPGARGRRQLLLSNALEIAPDDRALRAAALEAARAAISRGGSPPAALRELTAVESLIVAGWRAAADADWQQLRRLEGALAELPPTAAHYWQALLLRAQWRAHSSDREELRQALSLLDSILSHRATAQPLMLYAGTADRAGFPAGTLAALSELSRLIERQHSPTIAAAARALLRNRDYPPSLAQWARRIDRRLAS